MSWMLRSWDRNHQTQCGYYWVCLIPIVIYRSNSGKGVWPGPKGRIEKTIQRELLNCSKVPHSSVMSKLRDALHGLLNIPWVLTQSGTNWGPHGTQSVSWIVDSKLLCNEVISWYIYIHSRRFLIFLISFCWSWSLCQCRYLYYVRCRHTQLGRRNCPSNFLWSF